MQYCMTMEQTRRIAVFFDSDDDEAAIEKANQILKETPSEDYESGDKEYDYALCNVDTERTILDWDKRVWTKDRRNQAEHGCSIMFTM